MRIDSLVRKSFATVDAWQGAASAERVLLEQSFAVVLDGGRYKGILTAEDLLRSPRALIVDCLRELPVVSSDDDLRAVLQLMKRVKTTSLPVFQGGEFVGVCVRSDIADHLEEHGGELQAELDRRTAELYRAQKMEAIGTMAAGIAHDFNNILTPIMAHADMIVMAEPNGPAHDSATQILRASGRARDLVRRLLTLSRRQAHEPQPMQLRPVIDEGLKLLRASLPSTVTVHTELTAQQDTVLADPTEIQQVLINLCTNAQHAMEPAGGLLEVVLDNATVDESGPMVENGLRPDTYVRLTVRDTGCGMSDLVKAKIFEPYFTTKAPEKGSGLGLAVAHGIVSACGGQITVQSDAGTGTSFTVWLPSLLQEGATLRSHSGVAATGTESVLLVDDETAVVEIVSRILKHLGYRVSALTSAASALEALQSTSNSYDIVVADLTMPRLTGDALMRQAHLTRPGLPFVLMSGGGFAAEEARALQSGASAFLRKPFSATTLASTVRRALDGREGAAGRART